MVKKTVTYTDYNGNERKEDFYFDFSQAEVVDMQTSKTEGFADYLQRIIDEKEPKKIMDLFKDLVLMAYGEKTADGKYFIKERPDGTKVCNEFRQSAAYPQIYMELAFDDKAAADFVNGIFPQGLEETLAKYNKGDSVVTPIAAHNA